MPAHRPRRSHCRNSRACKKRISRRHCRTSRHLSAPCKTGRHSGTTKRKAPTGVRRETAHREPAHPDRRRRRRWRRHRRNAMVQHTYLRGMIALAEGHWQEAEKWLLKHVHHSETPALHYLAAAEAAEEQGSHVRRDSYLRAALTQDPRTEVAVGLAQARYYIEHRDPADASTLLGRLYVTSPKHPAVLKRLMVALFVFGVWVCLLGLVL